MVHLFKGIVFEEGGGDTCKNIGTTCDKIYGLICKLWVQLVKKLHIL